MLKQTMLFLRNKAVEIGSFLANAVSGVVVAIVGLFILCGFLIQLDQIGFNDIPFEDWMVYPLTAFQLIIVGLAGWGAYGMIDYFRSNRYSFMKSLKTIGKNIWMTSLFIFAAFLIVTYVAGVFISAGLWFGAAMVLSTYDLWAAIMFQIVSIGILMVLFVKWIHENWNDAKWGVRKEFNVFWLK